ncbi:MAG TPA: NAD-dependent epimerase/dehydratase family protein [Candidatus Dormibacteraeota bacterium]|jgi:nucleoside-diphosphate-sugar epimerase|nr:NAD-dependent epimerase/dehydratase family protein [Candidatus Dormibacteraeota bacterium]
MRVFLTGGTGFIGSEVARRLRARGDEVRALVRSPGKAAALREIGAELVEGDLTDSAAIAAGMHGRDAVIHGAAIYEVGVPASRHPAMYQANVDGTEAVLGAALAAGVPRVVYISTINAFGNTEGQVVDESHQHSERYVSYYDETKHLAHKAARRLIGEGLPCVIVQPGAVYGPGDHSAVGTMMRQFLDHRLPAMMFPHTGLNLVHRDDVADGILLALDRGRAGEQYVLGGEITTMAGMIGALARVTGRRPPRLTMPTLMIRLSAPLGPLMGPAMGFPPNFRELVKASDGVTYWARDDKARAELGYAPRALEQGLRDTIAAESHVA